MRVGILGSGQLGRMLALAAHPLGHDVFVLGDGAGDPAMAVARGTVASLGDVATVERFASSVEVVTFEFENVPAAALAAAARVTQAWPPVRALEIGSDRFLEKTMFTSLGIATAPFRAVDEEASLSRAALEIGLPAVLKTRRLGYDGKGQKVLRAPSDVAGAHAELGGVPCVLEAFVAFSRELSVIAARDVRGAVAAYPLVVNVARNGILHVTRAPAPDVDAALARRATEIVRVILDHLGYVGVLAVELFQVGEDLVANEIAPRVHNTGHWTTEGAETSQFEQHVRAVTGAPLGATSLRGVSAMVNLVGTLPDPSDVLAIPGAHLHVYGKTPRPGRKLGHVTLTGLPPHELEAAIARVCALPGAR